MVWRSWRHRPSAHRGVSPVVGTILLVAIVVVLAGTLATVALGFSDELRNPSPAGSLTTEYVPTGEGNDDSRPYFQLRHEAGPAIDADRVQIKDQSGNTIRWNDIWTGGETVQAGETVHIDGYMSDGVLDPICSKGDTYWIIVTDEDGETVSIDRWEVPSDPQVPPGSSIDGDGDGIPDYC
ncbi:MAG: type IV pilin [Halococcoides sp.]